MIRRTRHETDGTTDIYEERPEHDPASVRRWRFWVTVVLTINTAITMMNFVDVHSLLKQPRIPNEPPTVSYRTY